MATEDVADDAAVRADSWPPARLHVVTGKGGTGKTTVAAALALALATGGGRVLLVEVEGRQGIAQLFDTPPLPYEERRVALAAGGGEVWALPVDPEQAMLEYLDIFYGMRRAAWALRRTGALEFATTIAPGVRDVLLTGKVKELVDRVGEGRTHYDAVVLDAPPTGRITQFLTVTAEVAGLTKVGLIRNQSESVSRVITGPETQVHVVTILEEMPVQETGDAIAEMRSTGLQVGRVLVNMVRPPHLPARLLEPAACGELDADGVGAALAEAGLGQPQDVVAALLAEAAGHAERVLLEQGLRTRLAHLDGDPVELPLLTGSIDLGALYQLAELLHRSGVRGRHSRQAGRGQAGLGEHRGRRK